MIKTTKRVKKKLFWFIVPYCDNGGNNVTTKRIFSVHVVMSIIVPSLFLPLTTSVISWQNIAAHL